MDDLPLPRTEARCPVPRCPWMYVFAEPETRVEGERVRLVIPPPAGKHLRPAEVAAGLASRPPRLAMPAPLVGGGPRVVGGVKVEPDPRDQDEAVVGAHLASHTEAEIAAAFPDPAVLDDVLERMERAGIHPRAA
jgi:hypothetical protein